MTKEQLKLKPIDLKVDGLILSESLNVNGMDFMIEKTVEELFELGDALLHYKRNQVTDAQLSAELGDVFIQIAILNLVFSKPVTQQMINAKLIKIANRNERVKGKNTLNRQIGFTPGGEQ